MKPHPRRRATACLRAALWCAVGAAAGLRGIPNTSAAELTIRIDHPPTNGTVIAAVFNSAGTFVNLRDPVRTITLPPAAAGTGCISNLPAGEYALVVYQDENGNGRLDKNFIGIPREPLGFSNRYWPQGPPTFARAAFQIEEGEAKTLDLGLRSVFGKLGLLGVGVGAISQTSPYRGSQRVIVQPIPAISYIGDRVQILGPTAQCGILKRGDLGLAATASYRLGAYREEDSPYLHGLGNRKDTLAGGLGLQAELPAGLSLSAGYEHDMLGRSGGGNGRLGLSKAFQSGSLTLSPQAALNWLTAELADYEYGVPEDGAVAGRPAYEPGDVVSPEAGLSLFVELPGAWRVIVSGSVGFLPREVTASPIVDRAQVFSGFLAITRLF